jgi:hypothetical protein
MRPTLTPAWNQHDAGPVLSYELRENGSVVYSGVSPIEVQRPQVTIGLTPLVYNAVSIYGAGQVKNDNQGNAYPTGAIEAGQVLSNVITIAGKNQLFFDASSATSVITTSAGVRALNSKFFNPTNGLTFIISVPIGARLITISYPDTLRDITSIKYVEIGNGEVRDTFTKTVVSVEGANGFAGTNYKVFSYLSSVPFGDTATYSVTI